MMHTGRTARWAAGEVPVTFIAFDLLHLDGQDLIGRPLVKRKRLLDELHLVGPAWATNCWHQGVGDTLFQVCIELGHEGVVAKKLDAPYPPGIRSRGWLKKKCFAWQRDYAPRRRPREWVER
jgi:bifunctional non-homologous end joining protein LigD